MKFNIEVQYNIWIWNRTKLDWDLIMSSNKKCLVFKMLKELNEV
jgi:hypothetical protein